MTHDESTRPPMAAIVVNPMKADVEALKEAVAAAEAEAGWAPSLWIETTVDDAGQEAVGTALRRGAAVVVAAGGDGTVRAVAEGLRGSRVPLALLPLGTGNLLARNLDIPLTSTEDAVALIFGEHERTMDLGVVEIQRADDGEISEHVFLVVAGIGIDAKMIKNTNSKLKKAVGWLAYVDGITRSLPELKPVQLRFSIDDGPVRSTSAHSVLVGNCGLLPGGILLMPEARIDDGVLDIAALRPRGAFGWLRVWNTLAFENGVLRRSKLGQKMIELGSKNVRDVVYRTGRRLTLEVAHPEEFQLDGDEFGEITKVRAWVEPGGLSVKVGAPAS
jgi:diacylglycerol kinase family enzyme